MRLPENLKENEMKEKQVNTFMGEGLLKRKELNDRRKG